MIDPVFGLFAKAVDKLPMADVFRKKSAARREHDQSKFRELDALMSEADLVRFLEAADDLEVHTLTRDPVDTYLEWRRYSSNDFLFKKVRKARQIFDDNLRDLRRYLSLHVSPDPPASNYLAFRPEQNPSRRVGLSKKDRDYFEARVLELQNYVDACMRSYKDFRKVVKSVLYV